MGSDICLGVCSLKALCRGRGVTGLSLGFWDDSTGFAHQLPKPVCCAVMLSRLGHWGWSSNPMNRPSWLLGSSAKGPEPGSRSWLCQYFPGASYWLELSSGIPNDGYSPQPFTEVICLLTLGSPCGSVSRGWCDPVWQGVIRMCCFTSAADASAIIPQLRVRVSVISWLSGGRGAMWGLPAPLLAHVLGTAASLAPAV